MRKISFCEIWNLFSRAPMKLSLGLLQITNYIHSSQKNVQKNAICFELFWYKVFVHWKLKLLKFLMDSVFSFRVTLFSYDLAWLFLSDYFPDWMNLFKSLLNENGISRFDSWPWISSVSLDTIVSKIPSIHDITRWLLEIRQPDGKWKYFMMKN